MQKFMYVSPYIRITQGYMIGSHKSSYAIDDGGSDTGKDYIIAPYDGVVKRIYSQFENEVFFVSDGPVEFADGTVDYATTMFVHQDSPMAYGMAVGKHYNQGEKIYLEGGRYAGKNGVFATHLHVEFARGTDANWYKNASGIYSLKNAKKPEDCCFIDDSYHILYSPYKFKNVKDINNNGADQVLYKGSKVSPGGCQIDNIKTIGNKTTFYSNKYGTWLPIEYWYRVGSDGKKYPNQISSKGNYLMCDSIFTVVGVSKKNQTADVKIGDKVYTIKSSGLYEVSNN